MRAKAGRVKRLTFKKYTMKSKPATKKAAAAADNAVLNEVLHAWKA